MMKTELLNAVKGLQLNDGDNQDQSFSIDEMLKESRSKKQQRKAPDALKKELEDSFLNPPTSFSPEWLNKLQQYVGQSSVLEVRLRFSIGDGTSL